MTILVKTKVVDQATLCPTKRVNTSWGTYNIARKDEFPWQMFSNHALKFVAVCRLSDYWSKFVEA